MVYTIKTARFLAFLLSAMLVPGYALAAPRPDAGQILQEQNKAPVLPAPSPSIPVTAPDGGTPGHGGPMVAVEKIVITGNTLFGEGELQALVADAKGKRFDLAGLKTLASRITAFYHAHDCPFAKAYIPAQTMKGGALHIVIFEGRYGAVHIRHGDARTPAAEKFLHALEPGAVITGKKLERATLILGDQPGYSFVPVLIPGAKSGTGDLDVRMKRDSRFGGDTGIDNAGNRYTGRLRAYADFHADSPFMFGDQVKISTLYTQEHMWYGAAEYSLPLGYSGLRGTIGYTQTDYELAKEFSSLDAHGTAKIASGGLSYPLVRSQRANITLGAAYQHKWLVDEQGSTAANNSKHSDSLPIAANFDFRDSLGGGGITYGALSWTPGTLALDHVLESTDSTTARSSGHFDKINLDVARLQALPLGLTLFTRAAGQWAAGNLDSSEKFGLGGPNGVRAYPTGESYGDTGALGQAELRYNIGAFTPYGFYDGGWIQTNAKPWAAGENNRTLGGAGLGLRVAQGGWHMDGTLAWRTHGGEPQSDTKHDTPQIFLRVGYKF